MSRQPLSCEGLRRPTLHSPPALLKVICNYPTGPGEFQSNEELSTSISHLIVAFGEKSISTNTLLTCLISCFEKSFSKKRNLFNVKIREVIFKTKNLSQRRLISFLFISQ
jgi:hypothetical protein